jgi:hypothetical protein
MAIQKIIYGFAAPKGYRGRRQPIGERDDQPMQEPSVAGYAGWIVWPILPRPATARRQLTPCRDSSR